MGPSHRVVLASRPGSTAAELTCRIRTGATELNSPTIVDEAYPPWHGDLEVDRKSTRRSHGRDYTKNLGRERGIERECQAR